MKFMNILIVDDNENITKLFRQYLELKNHKCVVENNGKNVLSLLNKDSFDKIILDLAMPDFSGIDVLNNIKSKDFLEKIIVITASNITSEEEKNLLNRGIHAVLRKPVSIEVIHQNLMD